jgi:glycerophosphoryl diester phosphodiesterase family protein
VSAGPVPLRLRPLEIGDILDEIFRMYRRHFVLLAGLSVAFSIPLAALAGFGFAAFYTDLANQAANNNFSLATFSDALTVFGIGVAINLIALPLMYGAVSLAVADSALGRPVTLRGVLAGALRRYFHVAGYLLLLFLMFGVAFCIFPLWIWIAVGWAAVLPVIFVENRGLGDAMRRSWQLVQGRWWRTFFLLFLVFLLNYVVSIALQAFLYLGQLLLSIVMSPFMSLAVYEAGSIVVSGLLIPILQIALVLIYFDLRVRKEGLDLFQLAQRVATLPAAQT